MTHDAQSALSGPERYALLREAVSAVVYCHPAWLRENGVVYVLVPKTSWEQLGDRYREAPVLLPEESEEVVA